MTNVVHHIYINDNQSNAKCKKKTNASDILCCYVAEFLVVHNYSYSINFASVFVLFFNRKVAVQEVKL